MKRILTLTTMFVALATLSFGQITGTAHDFNNATGNIDLADDNWNSSASNKKCGPCHVPHNANTALPTTTGAPLWSHAIAATGGYQLYAGTNMDATPGQPAGTSLLCLSCHDGTLDLDDHLNSATTHNTLKLTLAGTPNTFVGTDLRNDHPVSFTWVNEAGLNDPTATASGLGLNIDDDMLFGAGNDQLECASCHDPHGVTGVSNLLRKDNTNSELCLTCHKK